MKRLTFIACVLVALASLSFVTAQEKPAPKTETKSADWKGGPATVAPSATSGRRALSLREARRLGITLSTVRGHMKALKADGSIDETSSSAEISALVLDRISSGDPKAFGEGIDLDSLLAFIEQLIELIMKLFVF